MFGVRGCKNRTGCKFGEFILQITLSPGQIETRSDPEKLVILPIYQDQPQSRPSFLTNFN